MGEAKRRKLAQKAVGAPQPGTPARDADASRRRELEQLDRDTERLLKAGDGAKALPLCRAALAALPDSQAARNRLRMALVMAMQPAASRSYRATGAALAPVAAEAIDVVAFHVSPGTTVVRHADSTDYAACLRALAASVAHASPRARTVLLTDERSAFPADLGFDRIDRLPIDPGMPMYERMRAQEQFLRERPAGRVTAFVDSDVLVNRPLADIFADAWDVGLTWREGILWDAPVNGGVIFAGAGGGATRFFAAALRQYDRIAGNPEVRELLGRDPRVWWGDQMALAGLLGYAEFHRRPPGQLMVVDDATVKLLPCEQYNFESPALAGDIDVADKYILHFKGENKRHIARYLASAGGKRTQGA